MSKRYIEALKLPIEKNPKKIFLTHIKTGRNFTYGDIAEISAKIAHSFATEGMVKGDKVAIVLPNCPEFVFLYFACMQAGAIAIPVNINLHPHEIAFILENSDAKTVYFGTTINEEIIKVINGFEGTSKHPLEIMGEESPSKIGTSLLASLEKIHVSTQKLFPVIDDNDTQLIIYTSGTTGRPKGVVLTYGVTIGNISAMLELHQVKEDYKFYAILPLSYLGGFYNQVFLPYIANASVALERMFDTKVVLSFWDTVIKHKINTLWFVPSIMSLLLQADRKEKGAEYCKNGGIKHVFIGTAPLPDTLREKFTARYGVPIYENYGLSELLWVSSNAPTLPEIRGVGKCLRGVEVFTVDADGNRLAKGMLGEVAVVSPYTLESYYKLDEEFRDRFKDGIFYTGDIGFLDEDGYLHISDRKKDIIIKGGVNISPKEIEDVILGYPGITDAAVIGAADDLYGEKLIACVTVNDDIKENDIKIYCGQRLASFKIPQSVLILESFPRSTAGKIQKNRLKEIIKARANE